MLAMMPPSFKSSFNGIEVEGLLSSQVTISGFLTDSLMSIIEINLQLEKGVLKYEGFSLPLNDIAGDVTLDTDLKTDTLLFVKIRELMARTHLSNVKIEDLVNHHFSDIYSDLTTTAVSTPTSRMTICRKIFSAMGCQRFF